MTFVLYYTAFSAVVCTAKAFQAVPSGGVISQRISSSSLFYRDEPRRGWFRSTNDRTSVVQQDDDKQSEIDEYLTFLDRRYNRLHADESQQQEQQSFIAGLLPKETIAKQCNELGYDPLCVLGVADLASPQLLQKRHILPKSEHAASSPALAVLSAGTLLPSPLVLLSVFSSLTSILNSYRRMLLSEEASELQTVLAFLSKTWASIDPVRSAKTIWKVGGGIKSLRWTMTVMTALTFLLIKPLTMTITRGAAAATLRHLG